MRLFRSHIILCVCLMLTGYMHAFSQDSTDVQALNFSEADSLPYVVGVNPRLIRMRDTLWLVSGICKPLRIAVYTKGTGKQAGDTVVAVVKKHVPLLKVHGNVQYDFIYRSYVDTPFSQKDFQQHTVRASLSVTIKDKYPLRVNISTRASNSPYFRNFLDAGLLLDQFTFTRDAKKKLADKITAQRFNKPELKMMEQALSQKQERFDELKLRLSNPDILQRIMEEREKEYYRKKYGDSISTAKMPEVGVDLKALNQKFSHKNDRKPGTGSADQRSDSTGQRFSDFINKKKEELDSLKKDIASLRRKVDSTKNLINKNVMVVKDAIYKAKNRSDLKRIELDHGIPPDKQEKIEHFLSNLRSVSVGRSMVNYTELTAQGISLTGVNAEYNDRRLYAAVTAGKIDYGFRDLLGKNNRQRGQHLMMARVGIGNKDRRALILSVFSGRKFNYGSAFSDTISDKVNIAGYSLEAIWAKDENNGLSAEIAKSTKPVTGRFNENRELNNLVKFSDRSNLGVNFKGQARIKETDTRISGLFRKTGENFQSFSLFTYNTDQTAWHLKLDQTLFNNKVDVTAMLRRNDFTNPFTDKTFKTSTVFTTLQTTVRIPKWPVLSVGYFPGSQLYIIDRERIRENAYYIFNGSLIYAYSAGPTRMTSSAIYNRYSSKGTDSGFIAYTGINYLASHSVMWKKFQLQGGYAFTDQEQLKYYTLEFNGDYNPFSFLRLGGGGKYNKVKSGQTYWGHRAQLSIGIRKLGSLQLLYEKSWLPTINKDLFPVEMGRVTWFKYF